MIHFARSQDENRFLAKWVMDRIPETRIGDCQCIAVLRDGKVACVAAFNNYREVDIEIQFASDNPRWATKQTITAILAYPFVQLECQRLTAMVLKSNRRCRKLLSGAGFKEEGRHAHAGPNKETMMSYGMTRDFYMEKYFNGIKESTRTAACA